MILEGYVRDKNKEAMANAILEVKGENFITIHSTQSDENGYYKFDIPEGHYPFLTVVKDYGVNYLEYWCQNINLKQDMQLNVAFDKLEIYGLHAFRVKGGANALMIYFRPMSLVKFQQGQTDIAPEISSIKVEIDGKETPVLFTNKVKECAGDMKLTAYLIQVDTEGVEKEWTKLDIEIRDDHDNYGAAAIFND